MPAVSDGASVALVMSWVPRQGEGVREGIRTRGEEAGSGLESQ